MSQLRLALAQVDSTVGDLTGNAALVRQWSARREARAHTWSPSPRWCSPATRSRTWPCAPASSRRAGQRCEQLARDLAADGLGDLVVVVGYLDRVDPGHRDADERPGVSVPKGRPQNAAAVMHRGQVVARYAKHHLPNYGVFDEFRIFTPGDDLTSCASTASTSPSSSARTSGRTAAPSRSPARPAPSSCWSSTARRTSANKDDVRRELVTRRAAEAGCALAYVNLVGGQDELVFDGDSIVVAADGEVLARAPQFEEELLVVDLDLPPDAAHEAPPRRRGRPARRPQRGAGRRRTSRAAARRAAARRRGGDLRARSSSGCATTCARTASARCSSASPAGSTPRWSPRSPATRSAPSTSSASPSRAATPASTPGTTPPSSPSGPASTTGSCRSRRWSTPSSTRSASPASPRRTCRPASAA